MAGKKNVVEEEVKVEAVPKKSKVVLKDTAGNSVEEKDYFFPGKDKDGGVFYAPDYFHKYFGEPVTREDLIVVFNKIFKPKYGFLFYKDREKEVYLVIVPIKYSTTIGEDQNSIASDFQKHAISFLNEGSVNLDTLRMKLERIRRNTSIKIEE